MLSNVTQPKREPLIGKAQSDDIFGNIFQTYNSKVGLAISQYQNWFSNYFSLILVVCLIWNSKKSFNNFQSALPKGDLFSRGIFEGDLHIRYILEDECLIEFWITIFPVHLRLVFRLLVWQKIQLDEWICGSCRPICGWQLCALNNLKFQIYII